MYTCSGQNEVTEHSLSIKKKRPPQKNHSLSTLVWSRTCSQNDAHLTGCGFRSISDQIFTHFCKRNSHDYDDRTEQLKTNESKEALPPISGLGEL